MVSNEHAGMYLAWLSKLLQSPILGVRYIYIDYNLAPYPYTRLGSAGRVEGVSMNNTCHGFDNK